MSVLTSEPSAIAHRQNCRCAKRPGDGPDGPPERGALAHLLDELPADALVSLDRAVELFPPIDGKAPSKARLYYWARHGVYGVKLWSALVGRKRVTTAAAIQRFLAELAAL
jgi:hypothetical protein